MDWGLVFHSTISIKPHLVLLAPSRHAKPGQVSVICHGKHSRKFVCVLPIREGGAVGDTVLHPGNMACFGHCPPHTHKHTLSISMFSSKVLLLPVFSVDLNLCRSEPVPLEQMLKVQSSVLITLRLPHSPDLPHMCSAAGRRPKPCDGWFCCSSHAWT